MLGAAAYDVLQGGNVFQGVERHYPVVVVARQQEHSRVLDPIAFWDVDVMERRVPRSEEQQQNVRSTADMNPLQSTH